MALFVELLAEVRGGREETRTALEHLAGQVRVLHETQGDAPAAQPKEAVQLSKKEKRQAFENGIVAGIAVAIGLLIGLPLRGGPAMS